MSEKHHRLSPLEPLVTVSIEDPAIDIVETTAEGLRQFAETRDLSILRFFPGMQATKYTLRVLSRAALARYVDLGTSDEEKHRRALACSLEQIDNPPDPKTGEPSPLPWRPRHPDVLDADLLGCSIVNDDAIFALVQPYGAIAELGKLVYDRAHVHPKAQPVFSAPPGSYKRVAERLLRAAPKTPSQESPDPTPPSGQTSGDTGNATAAGSDGASPATP